jgi:hypothetical protein
MMLNDTEIKKQIGLWDTRLLALPLFNLATDQFKETYEVPTEDLQFFFSYLYPAELSTGPEEDQNSFSLFRIKRGGYYGTYRQEFVEYGKDIIPRQKIKIYDTAYFRPFFNKAVPKDEREMIWEIIKLANKALADGGEIDDKAVTD